MRRESRRDRCVCECVSVCVCERGMNQREKNLSLMCDWKHCMRYGFLCCELTPVCEVWEMSFHSLLKYTHSQISIHTLLPAQTFANIPFNYAYLDHWQEVYTYCILFIDVQTWDTWGILTRTQICHRKQTNKRSSTKSSVFLIQRPPNILIHSESSSNCGSSAEPKMKAEKIRTPLGFTPSASLIYFSISAEGWRKCNKLRPPPIY